MGRKDIFQVGTTHQVHVVEDGLPILVDALITAVYERRLTVRYVVGDDHINNAFRHKDFVKACRRARQEEDRAKKALATMLLSAE